MWTRLATTASKRVAAATAVRAHSTAARAPLRVAVLGAGRIGWQHAQTLAALPVTEVAAVIDPDVEAAHRVAGLFGGDATSDEAAALADDIDCVFVCSPTPHHARHSIDAARAGKHIFCEKPVSLDVPVIKEVVQEVAAAGVKFQVGFNRRFDPSFARVRAAVDNNEIGALHQIRITSRDPAPPPIAYVKVSGGMLLDMTIHDFDLARFMAGPAQADEVYCVGGCMVDPAIGEAGDIDTAVVVIKFDNGVVATIDNSRSAAYGYDQRVEVFGSGGAAEATNTRPTSVTVSTADSSYAGSNIHHFFMERYQAAYTNIASAFAHAVVNDTPVPVGGEDGLESVRVGLAAMKSMQENRPVKLAEIEA